MQLSPQEAAQELLRRRLARSSLLHFTTYTKPNYEVNWHHRALCGYLDRFVAGEIRRLMVFMPPRHGKSELVSRRLPAYLMGRNPEVQIIACSYSADLASRMNRDTQRIIDSPRYRRLFPETTLFGKNIRTIADGAYLRNSDIFEIVGHQGSYRSAGVGGGITGMGFDYGIIDDPIKDRSQGDSQTYRESLWEWYTSTFYSRQEKDAAILITLTRWHEDDLAGRLLELARSSPEADQWTVLRLPAIAEETGSTDDPRAEGEPLWPSKYSLDALAKIRMQSTYEWHALYQQRPSAREGNMFKRSWFELVRAVPTEALRVRYWDKAGTTDAGAYTAGVLMTWANGVFYVEDVVRGQWSAHQREQVIKQTAQLDAQRYGNRVYIWLEQEPGSGGKESAENTVRNLAGYPVFAEPVHGDKALRAEPFAAQAEAGNVRLREADWNTAYLNELTSFPNGKYKDQVDASSGAFNKLALGWETDSTVVYDERVDISPI